MNVKTRDLSPVQYLNQLEIEWWICNFRRKIHPLNSQRKTLGKIANLKRQRIIEISQRNELPHVFDSPELMKKLNQQFNQNGGGCPTFEGVTSEDVQNYYSSGSDVRCFYGFDDKKSAIIKVAQIKQCNLVDKTVKVTFAEGGEENIGFSSVSRIF